MIGLESRPRSRLAGRGHRGGLSKGAQFRSFGYWLKTCGSSPVARVSSSSNSILFSTLLRSRSAADHIERVPVHPVRPLFTAYLNTYLICFLYASHNTGEKMHSLLMLYNFHLSHTHNLLAYPSYTYKLWIVYVQPNCLEVVLLLLYVLNYSLNNLSRGQA